MALRVCRSVSQSIHLNQGLYILNTTSVFIEAIAFSSHSCSLQRRVISMLRQCINLIRQKFHGSKHRKIMRISLSCRKETCGRHCESYVSRHSKRFSWRWHKRQKGLCIERKKDVLRSIQHNQWGLFMLLFFKYT